MANHLAKFGITDAQILRSPKAKIGKKKFANKVCDYAKSIAPEDTGEFKDSIHVAGGGDRVVSDDPVANIIEDGTVDTPEFAVFARTAHHFGGGGGRK